MNMPPAKVCRRIRQLFALVGSTPNAGEAENARTKLAKLLTKHDLTWNDLPAILAASEPPGATSSSASQSQPSGPPQVNVLDLVLRLVELQPRARAGAMHGLRAVGAAYVCLWPLLSYASLGID